MAHSYASSSVGMNPAIRKTLVNTFIAVGAMMLITAITSYFTLDWQIGISGLLMAFGVSLLILFLLRRAPGGWGLVALAVFAATQGIVMGPLLNSYLAIESGSSLILNAAGLTAIATFGCAVGAITAKRSYSWLHGILLPAVLVLIVASIASIFYPIPALTLGISVMGALLFTVWLFVDINDVAQGKQDNYVYAAISIYLDILNLFQHLLRLLSLNRD